MKSSRTLVCQKRKILAGFIGNLENKKLAEVLSWYFFPLVKEEMR